MGMKICSFRILLYWQKLNQYPFQAEMGVQSLPPYNIVCKLCERRMAIIFYSIL